MVISILPKKSLGFRGLPQVAVITRLVRGSVSGGLQHTCAPFRAMPRPAAARTAAKARTTEESSQRQEWGSRWSQRLDWRLTTLWGKIATCLSWEERWEQVWVAIEKAQLKEETYSEDLGLLCPCVITTRRDGHFLTLVEVHFPLTLDTWFLGLLLSSGVTFCLNKMLAQFFQGYWLCVQNNTQRPSKTIITVPLMLHMPS